MRSRTSSSVALSGGGSASMVVAGPAAQQVRKGSTAPCSAPAQVGPWVRKRERPWIFLTVQMESSDPDGLEHLLPKIQSGLRNGGWEGQKNGSQLLQLTFRPTN
jgi:hypothetical protein